jgi:hypothetical protein
VACFQCCRQREAASTSTPAAESHEQEGTSNAAGSDPLARAGADETTAGTTAATAGRHLVDLVSLPLHCESGVVLASLVSGISHYMWAVAVALLSALHAPSIFNMLNNHQH